MSLKRLEMTEEEPEGRRRQHSDSSHPTTATTVYSISEYSLHQAKTMSYLHDYNISKEPLIIMIF